VNDPAYELAAILATGNPAVLYSGLSVLVSTAADGHRCAALASFDALEMLITEADPVGGADSAGRGDTFARSLTELRDTAIALESLKIWACAASVDTMEIGPESRLDGVMSTPRFLRETAGARRFIHV
jgi:peroxiredoxin family protein